MPPRLWLPSTVANNKHLTSKVTRSEALSLYRDILRTAKHFHWKDPASGQPYNQLLKQKARQEFEEARHETDALIVARLLVTGRDCVQQIQTKFNDATQAAWKRIETDNQNNKRK
jgi:hypothetical protein